MVLYLVIKTLQIEPGLNTARVQIEVCKLRFANCLASEYTVNFCGLVALVDTLVS